MSLGVASAWPCGPAPAPAPPALKPRPWPRGANNYAYRGCIHSADSAWRRVISKPGLHFRCTQKRAGSMGARTRTAERDTRHGVAEACVRPSAPSAPAARRPRAAVAALETRAGRENGSSQLPQTGKPQVTRETHSVVSKRPSETDAMLPL